MLQVDAVFRKVEQRADGAKRRGAEAAGIADPAAVWSAAKDHAAAQAGTDVDEQEVAQCPAMAEQRFGRRGGGRVVLKMHLCADDFGGSRCDVETIPAVEPRCHNVIAGG